MQHLNIVRVETFPFGFIRFPDEEEPYSVYYDVREIIDGLQFGLHPENSAKIEVESVAC
jgi:hypothetical protein